MKNKVYYGEYTLKHWINLMLTKNICLPDYQRHFVWQESDVKRLIQSLNDGQFVQPVTIALYYDGVSKKNIILDGQQRLTSLLLAYIGYFPDKKKFESSKAEQIAGEDDSAKDEDINSQSGILWRFSELLKYGQSKASITAGIVNNDKYLPLTDALFANLDDEFFSQSYLGFSYVIPESTVVTDIQKTFSQLFRNINYFGKKLDAMESRKSLYYQDSKLTNYFEGKCHDNKDVLGGLMIIEDLQPCKIDFVRYLSILSQYCISTRPDAKDIMVGYSAYSSRESFYADYVSFILGIEQEDRINKFNGFNFSEKFPDNSWQNKFDNLYLAIQKLKQIMPLKDKKSFSAWYEADFWLFGIIYYCVFKGKKIKEDLFRLNKEGRNITLKQEIEASINKAKTDPSFSKNSNRLGYVRSRLTTSIAIYDNYVQD